MKAIEEILRKNQMTNESRNRPSIHIVDALADELVKEYSNPKYREWYCGVIYKYGIEKVTQWRSRAKEGREPNRLFTSFVNDAGGYSRKFR